jgi:hypothetical protein
MEFHAKTCGFRSMTAPFLNGIEGQLFITALLVARTLPFTRHDVRVIVNKGVQIEYLQRLSMTN